MHIHMHTHIHAFLHNNVCYINQMIVILTNVLICYQVSKNLLQTLFKTTSLPDNVFPFL